MDWKGKDPNLASDFSIVRVTPEYGKTIGFQLLEGRDFSRDYATDSTGFVINEAAAKYMGLAHPVGEMIKWTDNYVHVNGDFRILGVVKDMVMNSPFEKVKQTIFRIASPANWITIKINPNASLSNALPKIEAVFKKLIPGAPFEYAFVDDAYAAKFAAEQRIGTFAYFFAVLAIVVSCLGLFGLASYVAEQRTKEIGVRKILGASVFGLWRLLSTDFVMLVLLSILIATPIAYYFMQRWLEQYAYRSGISWWVFAAAGVGATAVTLLTVSFQAIKAALANPVESLRAE
jgi:ABC-type antimicrobial peptide transport system permease subunit